MTSRLFYLVIGLAGLASLSVTGGCAHGPSTSAGGDVADGNMVRGSVAYRERMALPPDAVVEVWIIDASPLVMAAPVIAETIVMPEGRQVPIPFELRYDPSRIEPDHDYAVKAAIRSEGQILIATETDYLVKRVGRRRPPHSRHQRDERLRGRGVERSNRPVRGGGSEFRCGPLSRPQISLQNGPCR